MNKNNIYIKLKNLNQVQVRELIELLYGKEITMNRVQPFSRKFTCRGVERRLTGYSRPALTNKEIFLLCTNIQEMDTDITMPKIGWKIGSIRNLQFIMKKPLDDSIWSYISIAFKDSLDDAMASYFLSADRNLR